MSSYLTLSFETINFNSKIFPRMFLQRFIFFQDLCHARCIELPWVWFHLKHYSWCFGPKKWTVKVEVYIENLSTNPVHIIHYFIFRISFKLIWNRESTVHTLEEQTRRRSGGGNNWRLDYISVLLERRNFTKCFETFLIHHKWRLQFT